MRNIKLNFRVILSGVLLAIMLSVLLTSGGLSPVFAAGPADVTVLGAGLGTGTVVENNFSVINCTVTAGTPSGTCTDTQNTAVTWVMVATPDADSVFGSWANCTSLSTTNVTDDTCTVDIVANGPDVSVTVTFDPGPATLTVAGAGTLAGIVADTTPGSTISCTISAGVTSGDCSELSTVGTAYVLVASPPPPPPTGGAGWSGCDSVSTTVITDDTCNITLAADSTVTANFDNPTLTVNGTGAGSGTAIDLAPPSDEIDCTLTSGTGSGDCTSQADNGTSYAIVASPTGGSTFIGWTGCDSLSTTVLTDDTCNVTLAVDTEVTAQFEDTVTLTVAGAGALNGTVTDSVPGSTIACTVTAGVTSGDCTEVTLTGTTFKLVATPGASAGYSWSGCNSLETTTNPNDTCVVDLSSNTTVTVTFDPPGITVQGDGTGSGTVTDPTTPGGTISCTVTAGVTSGDCNEGVSTLYSLVAVPAAGSTIGEWLGCDSLSSTNLQDDTCDVTPSGAQDVTVRFDTGLEIHSLSWDVIGLDSNKPADEGPSIFPLGYRVCNTTSTATDVTVTFDWLADPRLSSLEPPPNLPGGGSPGVEDESGTYIDIQSGNTTTLNATLAAWDGVTDFDSALAGDQAYYPMDQVGLDDATPTPDHCADFYFNVEVQKTTDAFSKYRWYEVNVTGTGSLTARLPDHYLYVEKLVSQNRNQVTGFCDSDTVTLNADGTCPTQSVDVVVVGETYNYRVNGQTKDFEQLVLSLNFPNNLFQVNSVDTVYDGTLFNNALYGDPCDWDRFERACDGTGKTGGVIVSDESITILTTGVTVIEPLIYDKSGASFHYNPEFNTTTFEITVQAVQEAIADIDKTVYGGHDSGIQCTDAGTSVNYPHGTPITYCFTVTNDTPATDDPNSDTLLTNWQITDTTFCPAPDLCITDISQLTEIGVAPATLGPGESWTYYYEFFIPATWSLTKKNIAGVSADAGVLSAIDDTTLLALPSPFATSDDTAAENLNLNNDADVIVMATAVSLAYFEATRDGSATHFEWATVTETANVGFNLYVETADGLQQVNQKMVTSHVVDSLLPQFYDLTAGGLAGDNFYIEDIDTRGNGVMRGPFTLGETFGVQPSADPIDWPSISAEVNANAQVRADSAQTIAASASAVAQRAQRRGQPFAFPAFELRVDHDGLYHVTYEQLAAAGLDLNGVPSSLLALTAQGQSVPLDVQGSGQFGPGSAIVFYGEALDTLYTDTNVYRLQVDASLAQQIGSEQGRPRGRSAAVEPFYMETVTLDEELQYTFASPLDDPWFDTGMLVFSGSPNSWSFGLDVDSFAGDVAPVTLNVDMYGVTDWNAFDPDHHVITSLNGVALADDTFDGHVDHSLELSAPAGTLKGGGNTLTLEMPADTDAPFDFINFDEASITYPRQFVARGGALTFSAAGDAFRVENLPSADVLVYRISGDKVVSLDGAQVNNEGGSYSVTFRGSGDFALYAVSAAGALSTPDIAPMPEVVDITSGQADFLIVSHPDFIGGLQPLVEARQAQGLTMRVVNVEDVYTQFSAGVFDAQAIRDYVGFAVQNMGVRYVLLVGGDTYDYRNYQDAGSLSFVPTLYAATDAFITFAPTDPLFVDVDYDNVPDVPLGRFPVRTSTELDAIVNKTLQYDAKDYGNTAVFAADSGTSFSEISDGFIEQLPDGWSVTRAYLDDGGVGPARALLLDAMNSGVALTSYVGHSSSTRWTFAGLFNTVNAAALTNNGRPTAVIQWGCWNTYFVEPSSNSLGHALLLDPDRGAAL